MTGTRRAQIFRGAEAAFDRRPGEAACRPGQGQGDLRRRRGGRLRAQSHRRWRSILHPPLHDQASRERVFTIGSAGDWTTTAARAEAKRLRRLIDAGGDPLGEIEDERAAPTVSELCDRFEAEHLPRKRPRTAADYEGMLRVWIRPHFGPHAKVADVTFADIDALHRKISKTGCTYRANRTVAILSKMFSLAVRWHMRETNPCKGIEKNKEYGRRRYLSADELARLQGAGGAPRPAVADVFRLLLLTGARRGEVLGMRWADVDLTEGIWSKPPS